MVGENIQEVRGFVIENFTVKPDKVIVKLGCDLDEIRTGNMSIGEFLASMQLHIEAAAGGNEDGDIGLIVGR
jgi:hypothetical protein